MDTPTYDAQDLMVWKPQPGQNFAGGLRYRESFGGVVAALQDAQVSAGTTVKSYPSSFAGIIAAIEDLSNSLTEGTLPDVGAPPPGWEIIVDGDGNVGGDWQQRPPNGSLWFDTRQGRLFIAIDGSYYQTNGGDGIAHVDEEPPTAPPVVGSTWYDTDTSLLYVYIGDNTWSAVVSDGDITITTATLPLAIARSTFDTPYQPQVLPDLPSLEEMQVQKDYNTWLMSALINLDQALTEGSVTISEEAPTDNVVPGTLWYDSNTLELSIYYQDDDSAQWVPVSVGYALEEAIAPIQTALELEKVTRENAINNLYSIVSSMNEVDDAKVSELEIAIQQVQEEVNNLNIPNEELLASKTDLDAAKERITALENTDVDLSNYATHDHINNLSDSLTDLVESKPHLSREDIQQMLPDISTKIERADLDALSLHTSQNYLSRKGGTLTGSFTIQNSDLSKPVFDASSQWYNGKELFKLQSYAATANTATFGATENLWEYAWNFSGNEDFAWVYGDSNKVFSISKDGPACSQLHIGTFQENNSNGRKLQNTIEVGQMLQKHQAKFTSLKTAVQTATDFDTLKSKLLQALS